MKTGTMKFVAAAALFAVAVSGGAQASASSPVALDMFVGQTMVMKFDGLKRMAVGNPAVADAVTFPGGSGDVLLNAKAAGVTTLNVWDGGADECRDYLVRVSAAAAAYGREVYRFRNYTLLSTEYKTDTNGRTITTKAEQARVDYVANVLKPVLGERFSIDSTRNQVVLSGTPDELKAAKSLLDEMDRPLRQVLIEASVVEISQEELKRLGGYLLAQQGKLLGSSDTRDGGGGFSATFDTFTDLASRFTVTMDTLKAAGVGKTLVHSKVAVLDGNLAWIQAGESLPVAARGGDTGLVSYNYVETGVILDVVTRVGEDDTITLWLRPEVSNVSGWVGNPASSNGTSAPIIDSRQVMSEVRLKDGESVLIGGLTNEDSTVERKKVPVLGDIPGIGKLFRSKTETYRKTELVVSITPHILPAAEATAAGPGYIDMSGGGGVAQLQPVAAAPVQAP